MESQRWMDHLEEEDRAFIKRFVLSSGSLKDLATAYGVTYPTLRLRLDRLIEKIKALDNPEVEDPHERLIRALFADGKLETGTFKQLLGHYQKQRKESHVPVD